MIVGIDIGTRHTGFAYLNKDYFFSKVIEPDRRFNGKRSLINLAEKISNEVIILDAKYIAFENYAFKKSFINIDLGELVGMILFNLRYYKCNILFVPPKTVKKIVSGSGSSKKKEIKKEVLKMYPLKVKTSHEADALAICHVVFLYLKDELEVEVSNNLKRRMICLG